MLQVTIQNVTIRSSSRAQSINAMQKQDIIRPSKSLLGAPAILGRRKDLQSQPQSPRFVVDYRALDSVTKGDGFPLPQVIDILIGPR